MLKTHSPNLRFGHEGMAVGQTYNQRLPVQSFARETGFAYWKYEQTCLELTPG